MYNSTFLQEEREREGGRGRKEGKEAGNRRQGEREVGRVGERSKGERGKEVLTKIS